MTSEKLMVYRHYRHISETVSREIPVEYDFKRFQTILKDSKIFNPILHFSALEASTLLGHLKSNEECCGKDLTGIDATFGV